MIPFRLTAVAALVAAPLAAQQKQVNLTGSPIGAIVEPFSAIVGIRELPGNKAITADPRELKVFLVDFGNGEAKPISRKGSGPGEFQFPLNVLAGPNNETWITDPPLNKVHAVSAAGVFGGTVPSPEPNGGGGLSIMAMPRGVDRDGRLYYQGMPFNPETRQVADSVDIQRWNRSTKKMETIGRVPSGMTGGVSNSGGGRNMSVRIGSGPLAPTETWVPLPDGRIAIAKPNPYRIDILGAGGALTRGTAQPYTPIKVTAADRDAYRQAMSSGATTMSMTRSSGGGSSMSMGMGAAPAGRAGGPPAITDEEFPETKPPFTGQGAVMATPEGEIWVLRTRTAGDKVPTYDIWDGTGKMIGKATLRPNSRVVGFGAGTVYVERKDPEDDLLYLEKWVRR